VELNIGFVFRRFFFQDLNNISWSGIKKKIKRIKKPGSKAGFYKFF